MNRVVVDAGPLVAMLSKRDSRHEACIAAVHGLPTPMLTCWPVIVEAAWLLRREPHLVQTLLRLHDQEAIQVVELGTECLAWCAQFLERYKDLPAEVADAALVYLAEQEGIDTVFTLDQRDFSVYRMAKNRKFQLVPLAP